MPQALTAAAAATLFQTLAREGGDLVALAQTYANDGAFYTAAERLEEAAAKLRRAQRTRNVALGLETEPPASARLGEVWSYHEGRIIDENGLEVFAAPRIEDARRVLSMQAALMDIVRKMPDDEPEDDTYEDSETAYINGSEVTAWANGETARKGLAGEMKLEEPLPRSHAPEVPLWAVLDDMLAYKREQFDGDPETDLNVSGADLVDAFTEWRGQLKDALRAARPVIVYSDTVQIVRNLQGAISSMDDQISQMEGMFDDDDGAIAQARADGDDASEEAHQFLGAAMHEPDARPALIKIGVTLQGGMVQDVYSPHQLAGVEVVVIDYDTDGTDDGDLSEVEQDSGDWEDAVVHRHDLGAQPMCSKIPAIRDKEGDEADAG